mgnify:CR=1 FL=1|tara:strand:+ start:271 stop:519 length:249 start_codon:yes stop_codon:yes gene_type:complete
MKDFLKIFLWFKRNLFKLIFILIGVVIIYTIVMFLIPIFQFVGFVGDGFNEIQNIFQEMKKHIEEFKWEKELPSSPNDDNSV